MKGFKFVLVILMAILAGCANKITYTFQDKVFDDEDDFKAEVTESYLRVKRATLPLQKPLTAKRLIIVFPSAEVIARSNIEGGQKRLQRTLKSRESYMYENLAWSTFESVKLMYEIAQVRAIYPHIAFRESKTLTNSLAPSSEYDTLVWYEEAQGMGQWFYSSVKYGRQVFVWDRTSKDVQINTNAYLSALEALAIRE